MGTMEYLHRGGYERNFLPYSWPQVYHNSFWSNYYTNYWKPSSAYYSSLTMPSYDTMPHYDYQDTLDLYNYQEPSQTYKSVESLTHGYYSKMVSKRYPFVNGHVAMFM